MFNGKFNTLLTVLLIIAIIVILGLIGYFGYSVYNKYYINKEAGDAVDAFEQFVGNNTNTVVPPTDTNNTNNTDIPVIGNVSEGNSIYSSTSDNTTKYYGYNVIGTISIPAINIEYPILEKVTTTSIKVAVAYLCGARSK